MSQGVHSSSTSAGKSLSSSQTKNFSTQSSTHDIDDNSTYVVILNQDDDSCNNGGPVIQYKNSEVLPLFQGVEDGIQTFTPKSTGQIALKDDIKLNLANGFDKYDSSASSTKVFLDTCREEEVFINSRRKQIMIPRVRHFSQLKNIPEAAVQKGFSPCGSYYVYTTETEATGVMDSFYCNSQISATDVTGSSGYASADMSSFETPSSHVHVGKHPTSRQIFFTSTSESCRKGTPSSSLTMSSSMPSFATGLSLKTVGMVHPPSPKVNPANFTVAKSSYLTSTPNSGLVIQTGRQSYLIPEGTNPCPFTDTSKIRPDVEYHTAGGSKVTLSKSIPQLVNTCKFRGKSKNCAQQGTELKTCASPIIFINPDDNTYQRDDGTKALVETCEKLENRNKLENSFKSADQKVMYQKSSKVGDIVVHVRVENNEGLVSVDPLIDQGEDKENKHENIPDVMNSTGQRPSFCVRNTRPMTQRGEFAQSLSLPTFNVGNLPVMQPNPSTPRENRGGQANYTQSNFTNKPTLGPSTNIGNVKSRSLLPTNSLTHCDGAESQNSQNSNMSSSLYSEETMLTNSQESGSAKSEGSEKDVLNDSLTSMQWLGGIKLKPDKDKSDVVPTKKDALIQWRQLSQFEIQQIAKEYGKVKRPPFSYMTLIQMALHSREDKRMTLREICKWIEDTFPYYKHTAKSGWKNSIRHNLSLYSIFEREKSKKHGSHWTIREDSPDRVKVAPPKKATECMSPLPSCLPVTFFPCQTPVGTKVSTESRKSGLQPILPRPNLYSTPLQTYALIPIQNLPPDSSKSSPMMPDGASKIQKTSTKHKKKKCVNIAPKVSQQSLVRQAWLNAQTLASDSDNDRVLSQGNKDSEIENLSDENPFLSTKKLKSASGLPKPKIYSKKTPPKRVKTRRKQKLVAKERELMQDTSDEEIDFINALEKDVPSRKTDQSRKKGEENVTTSTPFKSNVFTSPQLASPISALTPLRNSSILDSSLLECLKDSDNENMRNIFGSPDLLFSKKFSPSHIRSPNMSQVEMLFSGLTPIKGDSYNDNNHNLSNILAEFEEEDGVPVNLSNISWSTLCQNIHSENENS